MAMFIKFKEVSDNDLYKLYEATFTIKDFYEKYFANIGIPLKDVRCAPAEYESAISLLVNVYHEMKSRKLVD